MESFSNLQQEALKKQIKKTQEHGSLEDLSASRKDIKERITHLKEGLNYAKDYDEMKIVHDDRISELETITKYDKDDELFNELNKLRALRFHWDLMKEYQDDIEKLENLIYPINPRLN